MDSGLFNIVYFDRRAQADRFFDRGHSKKQEGSKAAQAERHLEQEVANDPEVKHNVLALLSVFRQVHLCHTGASCLTTLSQLNPSHAQTIPTLLLVAVINHDDDTPPVLSDSISPTTTTPARDRLETQSMTGMPFLHHISFEIQQHKMTNMIIPIAILCQDSSPHASKPASESQGSNAAAHEGDLWKGPARILRYMDAGAVDVLTSPVSEDRLRGLPSHAYRTFKDSTRSAPLFAAKQSRKTSWVGVNESRPYSYLREAMVSGLMDGICNPDHIDQAIDPRELSLTPERREAVAAAVGTWAFSAHDFTDDELLHGALCMLEHALTVPELAKWKIGSDQLTTFLIACRRVYNSFVLYHNFRHACDVLQATFCFLLRIRALPTYRGAADENLPSASPIATLVTPFHALTLLVSAMGHDVGHPGVNNLFLVTLNAPLAQLYNDRSVLESFHCAAYSQILRRYWPAAFKDTTMRKMMINIILATDMALHAQYMTQMGTLHEKLSYNNNVLDGWSDKVLGEYRELTCCLLIKCADICNVARSFETAEEWARILTDEFHNQGLMEQELTMPSCLFGGPPALNDRLQMGNSQVSFMNIFAGPLFEGVTNLLPAMRICVEEMSRNKGVWQVRIDQEKEKRAKMLGSTSRSPIDGTASPRSGSFDDLSKLRTPPSPEHKSNFLSPQSIPRSTTQTTGKQQGAEAVSSPSSTTNGLAIEPLPLSPAPATRAFTQASQTQSQSPATNNVSPTSGPYTSMRAASTSTPLPGSPTNGISNPAGNTINARSSTLPRVRSAEGSSSLGRTVTSSSDRASGTGSSTALGYGSSDGGKERDKDKDPSKFGLRYWRTRLKSIGGGSISSSSSSNTNTNTPKSPLVIPSTKPDCGKSASSNFTSVEAQSPASSPQGTQ